MIAQAVNPGDVVQIDPERHPRFAACFATVDEVRGWGVTATVLVPASPRPNEAPIRLEFGSFVKVGKAEWVRQAEGA